MSRSRLPSLDIWLCDLASLLGPLPYRHYDALPDALSDLQAALLLLADQPRGGVALFRLSEAEAEAGAAVLNRLNAAAVSLAPGLVRAGQVVALEGGARAVIVLSPMPSLSPWGGPPDLRPVAGIGLDDLEELLVEHAPQDASAEELAAIPDLWDEPERALIALGALYPWRGQLLGTVAGALTYGGFDRELLPGQRVLERTHGDEVPRIGDIDEMIEAPTEALHRLGGLPVRLARALLINALALRRWDADDPGQPVIAEVAGGVITITSPGTTNASWRAREGQRPNPNLDALLRRLEIWTGPMLDLRTIQQELRRAGLPPLVVEEEADKVVLTCRVSAAAVEAARAEARARFEEPLGRSVQAPVPAPRPMAPPLLPGGGQAKGASALKARDEPPRLIFTGAPTPSAPLFGRAVLPAVGAAPPPRVSRCPARGAAAQAAPNPRFSAEARAAQLLELLGASPDPLTRHQIVHTLAWSRSTARAVLAALVAEGRVLHEAASPRSPHQRYRAA